MAIEEKGPEVLAQQVFISYSNENENDRQVADKIYDALKARGIPCWVAHRDIAAGKKWPTEISKAISNSRIMIVVLSEHTQKSSYVEMEVTQAAEEKLTIIPFCIGKVSLSAGGLKLLLGNCQWINAYPNLQDKDLDRLVETLQSYLGIEPRETFKKEEKPIEVKKESPGNRNEGNTKKSHRLKRILVTASIIIAIIVVFIYISQWTHNQESPTDPDFIKNLKSKGWKVNKNENNYWEAVYKNEDIIMVYIPLGKFLKEDGEYDNKKLFREVDLAGYWMGKYEVTFAQYDRYYGETRKKKPDDEGWGREKLPVINVSWDDAVAYCDWVSQKTELTFQLPTEEQWEKAACGTGGLIYPWGNDFDKNKCNSFESGLNQTVPVGKYLSGKSPYGIMDMAGNVWEWCSDRFYDMYYKEHQSHGSTDGFYRVIRGGSWINKANDCRAVSHFHPSPADCYDNFGFRLMMLL
ncbi:MAG: SUMF1/EgtB/PvdO family nonheme iron enzyme [Candidatus Aminicenantes bacterium]|nr:SUMF1/EgtB/PvdO family nonheme iron enzyme [Candidatus Aminicenantes bacterium]